MLEIKSGSIPALKAEMKSAKTQISAEIKDLKKQAKGTQDLKQKQWFLNKISDLERERGVFFSQAKVLPVAVGGIIINSLAFEKYVKKIGDLDFSVSPGDGFLKVTYKNEEGLDGGAEFRDLSEHYIGFENIPVAEVI